MECKCGGVTVDRMVIRNKQPAGEFARCTACGLVSWLWKTEALKSERLGYAPLIENDREQEHGRT